jgi:mono/diheme cytochrome c family protein
MNRGRCREWRAGLIALALLTGCDQASEQESEAATPNFAQRFLEERAFRRESLEGAVENPSNDYSALRLAEYATTNGATTTGWDALPIWNPPVQPLVPADAGFDTPTEALVWDGRTPQSSADWLSLGQRAFELWPVEIDDRVGALSESTSARAAFGMSTDARGRVAGVVRVVTLDGGRHVAWTCSGCHARLAEGGQLMPGPAAVELDRGGMSPALPDGTPPPAWAWGRGRIDVTADGIDNPTAIPDLRATSHQSHLHCEATLKNSLPALAVRIESLMIENLRQRFRPPRELAVALALFVTQLGEPGNSGDSVVATEGARLFGDHCAGCHHADGSSAPPVVPEVVGTDRRAADSRSRTTGRYRIPSLWHVADRGQLLHDGSVTDLAMLLDPQRLATVPGHPFGLDLEPNERSALIDFVNTIGS